MENRDERLWKMAKKRAGFKRHLYAYLAVCAFLWILWFIRAGGFTHDITVSRTPWPLWVTLGWGIAIVLEYFDAYHKAGNSLEEREYERLKNRNGQQ
jgi:hypothetical protein